MLRRRTEARLLPPCLPFPLNHSGAKGYTCIHTYICMHIYIYIYAVELKLVQLFAFYVLKLVQVVFLFVFENLVLPAEKRRIFIKNKSTNLCVKNWSNYVAQHAWTDFKRILGPILNTENVLFYCFYVFLLKPLFYCVFSKNAKYKDTQERKKDTTCEHTCANCSCHNVRFFFCIFHFGGWGISNFSRDVFDW